MPDINDNGSHYTCVLVAPQQIFVDAAEFGDLDLISVPSRGCNQVMGARLKICMPKLGPLL